MCDWKNCDFCRDQEPAQHGWSPSLALWEVYIDDPCFYCKQVINPDHLKNYRIPPAPYWLQGISSSTRTFEGPIVWSHTTCYRKNNPIYTSVGFPKFRLSHLMPSRIMRENKFALWNKQTRERDAIKSREELQFSEISQSISKISQSFDEYTKPIITRVLKNLPEDDPCIGIIKNFLEKYIDETCPICQNRIIGWPFDKSIVSTSCGHIFHGSCLQDWIITNPTCPMCRSVVEPDSLTIITIDKKSLDDARMCELIGQLTSLFTQRRRSI